MLPTIRRVGCVTCHISTVSLLPVLWGKLRVCNLRSGVLSPEKSAGGQYLIARRTTGFVLNLKIEWTIGHKRKCTFPVNRYKQRLQPTGTDLRAQVDKGLLLITGSSCRPRKLNLNVFKVTPRNVRCMTDATEVLLPRPDYAVHS